MGSAQVGVAEAVTSIVKKADFSLNGYKAERGYADWALELKGEGAKQLRVDVVAHPEKLRTELDARGVIKYIVPVEIAVRQRLGTDKIDDDTGRIPNSEIDPLVLFVEEINELFTAERIPDNLRSAWESTDIVTSCDPEMLRDHHQFLGIVEVTFNTSKEL